jgi:replicative DNA helicase
MNRHDNIWALRRRALLLATDAYESRSTEDWAEADKLLFESRSTRPESESTYQRDQAAERIEKMLTTEMPPAFELPFDRLNKCLLGGLRPGSVSVWAGDRAAGKSIFLDQALEHMAAQGANCHLMLSEMSVADRDSRWIQRRTKINEERVFQNDLQEDEIKNIVNEAHTFPWTVSEVAGASFQDIRTLMLDNPADVFALDLLSRVPARDHRELEQGFSMLCDTAVATNSVLIVAHHLNEKGNDDGRAHRPTLARLRGSGSIANFASSVLFIARDEDENKPGKFLPEGAIWFAKVRTGRPGGARVYLDPQTLSFKLLDTEPSGDMFA